MFRSFAFWTKSWNCEAIVPPNPCACILSFINSFGIPEPFKSKKVHPDVLFVPIVAFDENNHRIGYGGGFYDRYIDKINKIKNCYTIGLAFSHQKVKK